MYYIKQITDNEVIIANTLEERTVSKEELKDIKDTIVGYNKITQSLKVCTAEDMINNVVSRCKLSGMEIPYLKYGDATRYSLAGGYDLKAKVSYHVYNDNHIKITISTDVEYIETAVGINVDYLEVFEGIYDVCPNIEEEIQIDIEYDLFKEVAVSFEPIQITNDSAKIKGLLCVYNNFKIGNLTFTERTNLEELVSLSNIFIFVKIDSDLDMPFGGYIFTYLCMDDMALDYSNLVITDKVNCRNVIGGLLPYDFKIPTIKSIKDYNNLISNVFLPEYPVSVLRLIDKKAEEIKKEGKIDVDIVCPFEIEFSDLISVNHILFTGTVHSIVYTSEESDSEITKRIKPKYI